MPPEDVRLDLLTDSDTRSVCAYKGQARYLSLRSGEPRDIAWSYPEPLHDALRVKDRISFYAERAEARCVRVAMGAEARSAKAHAEDAERHRRRGDHEKHHQSLNAVSL